MKKGTKTRKKETKQALSDKNPPADGTATNQMFYPAPLQDRTISVHPLSDAGLEDLKRNNEAPIVRRLASEVIGYRNQTKAQNRVICNLNDRIEGLLRMAAYMGRTEGRTGGQTVSVPND